MAHVVSGGVGRKIGITETERLEQGIVLTDVVIKKREIVIDIPKVSYKDVEYERPLIKDKEYERPVVKEVIKETIRFVPVEQETIRYIPRVVECEKPVIVTKEYEKPVIREQIYEKPIVEQKKIEIVSVDNLDVLKAYVMLVKELNEELPKIQKRLSEIKDYKLVEKVISVPKLEYVTTQVERIEWVPVKREMPIQEK
jgi:hypothetical protein